MRTGSFGGANIFPPEILTVFFFAFEHESTTVPVMDGIEACQLICGLKDEVRKMPEIAFVTANVSESFKREVSRAGGNGFIVKPFTEKAIETYFNSQTRLTSLVTAL